MPQPPPSFPQRYGNDPNAAAWDLAGSLGSVVGAIVGAAEPTNEIGLVRHFIWSDDGLTPIGNILVDRWKTGKPLSVRWMKLDPAAAGSRLQMKGIGAQLLNFYPRAKRVIYERVTGASQGTPAAMKSIRVPGR